MDVSKLKDSERRDLIYRLDRDEAALTEAQYDRYMALRKEGLGKRRIRALGQSLRNLPFLIIILLVTFAGFVWLGGKGEDLMTLIKLIPRAIEARLWQYLDWKAWGVLAFLIGYFLLGLWRETLAISNLQAAVDALEAVQEEAAEQEASAE